MNIDTYVSELVPKEQRGPAFAYNQFIMFTAVPVVAFLSWQLVPQTIFGIDGWRIVVIIGSVGAFVIWWIRRRLPESPRWLEQHGRVAEADAIVANLEKLIRADTGKDLPPPEIVAGEADRKTGRFVEIWSDAYRSRTLMLVVYNLFQTVGYYGFSSWVTQLVISQGVSVPRSLAYTFVIAVAAPLGPLIGVLFADRVERKWQIGWAALGIASFGLLFAQQTTAFGVIACGVLITLCNNWMSFSFHAYQAELYPTRIRAQAVGFVYSWSRFSAIFSGFIIAFFLGKYGTIGVFRLHRRRHGRGLRGDRRVRTAGHQAPARGDRNVTSRRRGLGQRRQSSSEASFAPSTSASSLAHMIDGCTRRYSAPCAKPQSVLAMTLSRPDQTRQANDALRDQFGDARRYWWRG